MRRCSKTLAAFFCASLAAASPAAAQETAKPGDAGLRLTVYTNGLALVDEVRPILPTGSETIRLSGVGQQMITDSLRIDLGDGIDVREISLDSDLLTQQALLQRAVGKTVHVIRTNPATGAETVQDAEVLSIAGGIVLRIDGRIETTVPGRLVFDNVPADLQAEPALSVRLAAPLDTAATARLTYLTGGLNWETTYTAVLSPALDALDLEAWAKVSNNAGTDFGPAALSLVAGEVNRESAPRPKMLMRAESAMAADAGPVGAPRSELAAFHLYRLEDRVTLPSNATKQFKLLAADGVVVRRTLEIRSGAPVFGAVRGAADPVAAVQRLSVVNDVAGHLGVPLPAGLVRAYMKDADGQIRFIGEDRIADTPIGNTAEIDLGRSFDVTMKRRQTAFRQLGDRVTETTFVLELNNGGTAPAVVRVVEDIPGDWEILEESHTHDRDGVAATWLVTVPAAGKTDLVYKVRVRR